MKAVDDHGIPFDSGIENAFVRYFEHFLSLGYVRIQGKGKLQDNISGGFAFPAEDLVPVGSFNTDFLNDMLGDLIMPAAPILKIFRKGGQQKSGFIPMQKLIQAAFLE